jgi:SAM-dependent methyltransferase
MASRAPYRRKLTPAEVDLGKHRAMVGGLWDELGALQFEFMINRAGLTPEMRLLDLGCGSLRGGVRFIEHLDPGNYYGIDLNRSLVDAGRDIELPRYGLQDKLSPEQLLVADDFGAWRFGVEFDVAIAISLWTHLPLNQIGASLHELERVLKPGAALYATIFLCDDEARLFEPLRHEPGG